MLLFVVFVCGNLYSYEYDLSICAIFQNEAPYLREWIDYHKMIGVEHFYLYNNESNDDFFNALSSYYSKGEVTLKDWPTPQNNDWQISAYNDCLKNCKTKWIAFIDIDEFIVPMRGKDLKKILCKYYADKKAIYINWRQFGTSNLKLKKDYPILPYLTKCAPKTHVHCTHGKSIVKPKFVKKVRDPHWCIMKNGNDYYNGNGELFKGILYTKPEPHCDKLIRINHYTYRDESYMHGEKTKRMQKWNRSLEEMYRLNKEYNQEEDFEIYRILGIKHKVQYQY